jgi:hypothetical protein
MSVTTISGTVSGSYPVTITATSGSLTHSAGVTLSVTSPPDFSVSLASGMQSVVAGGSADFTVTISALNGFSGAVSFNVAGLPSRLGALGLLLQHQRQSKSWGDAADQHIFYCGRSRPDPLHKQPLWLHMVGRNTECVRHEYSNRCIHLWTKQRVQNHSSSEHNPQNVEAMGRSQACSRQPVSAFK